MTHILDQRVPWEWSLLALAQPVLHFWIGRRSPWPWFKAYCYFSILADCLQLLKLHKSYDGTWQTLIVPHAVMRATVAMESVYALMFGLELGTSRLRLAYRICGLAALSVVLSAGLVLLLNWSPRAGMDIPTFALLAIPRLWSLTLVLSGLMLWFCIPHPVPGGTLSHQLILLVYLVNLTAWSAARPVDLDGWWRDKFLEIASQTLCLSLWIRFSYGQARGVGRVTDRVST